MKNFLKPKPNRSQKRRMIKKGMLANVDVDLVSLLFDDVKPANGKSAIFKSSDGKTYRAKFHVEKFKKGSEGRVYVTVMEPGVKDSQGDSYTKEEIQKACDHFARKGLIMKNDVNHNMKPVNDAYIVENYILKAADKEHYPDTKIGSWVQCIKFDTTSDLWTKVEKGSFNGVSIYGHADDLGDNSLDTEAIKSELVKMREILEKQGNKDAVNEINERIKELEKGEDTQDLKNVVKAIESLNTSLNKAIAKSLQGEPGNNDDEDETIVINGVEVVVKAEYRELFKSIGTTDEPTKLSVLSSNEQSMFVDTVIEMKDDETLSEISVITMEKDEKIDKGLIDDIVFKNKLDGAPTAQEVGTGDISCPSSILLGAMSLERDTVEFYTDKYGEEAFGAYVNKKINSGVRKQLRILLFQGDRASGTAALKPIDGIIKKATADTNVTDIVKTDKEWEAIFEEALLKFSDDVLEEQSSMVIYVSPKNLIRIRSAAKKSANLISGRLVLDGKKIYFDDIPIKSRRMTDDDVIIGLPKFIIVGVRTDVEMFKEFKSDWKWYWNLRLRAGITYLDGFVKVFKLTTT